LLIAKEQAELLQEFCPEPMPVFLAERAALPCRTVGGGHINSLASRLERRAAVIAMAQPLSADDLRLAPRICRHFIRVGWVKTSVEAV
jgi:hypothetical protein